MMPPHVGDSVVVKSGVLDPDFGVEISGWEGRIEEAGDDTVFIRWEYYTATNEYELDHSL